MQLNISETGRQNVGRVDHLVYWYDSLAQRAAAMRELEDRFGVAEWLDVGEVEGHGIQVVVDWGSGIEMLCPAGEAGGSLPADGVLPEPQGRLQGVVIGVDDLDAAVARAEAAGAGTTPVVLSERVKAVNAPLFSVAREAIIDPDALGGLPLILGEFAPQPGTARIRMDDRGRMYPGGIDHVVFAVADEARLQHIRGRLSEVLGVEDWDDYGTLEPIAIRVIYAPMAGIELLCPARAGSMLDEHIAQHGPVSQLNQCLGVADLDAAMARLRGAGGSITELALPPSPSRRWASVRQGSGASIGGIGTSLCERVAPGYRA